MKGDNFSLSPLAQNSQEPSFINKMTADFAGDFREGFDINLGVGYVNDQTMPSQEIAEAYTYVMQHPEIYRNALNYGGAEGSPNLSRSIKDYYLKHHIGQLGKEDLEQHQVTIGVNGATSLLDAFSDIMAAGTVITGDPFYYSYTENLSKKGFQVQAITSDHNGIIPEAIEAYLESADPTSISYFYIISVNNPDSIILSNERRKKIVEIVNKLSDQLGRLIPVIFDRAYEDIIHNPKIEAPISALKYNARGNVFEIGTFSKILAPALRIGYMLSKTNELRRQVIQRISDIGFSNSLINQEISSRLIDKNLEQHREKVLAAYRQKALAIKEMISKELGAYTSDVRGGDAGFYFYITFKDIKTCTDSDFFRFLSRTTGCEEIDGTPELKARLIYIPGTVCSVQKQAEYQLRLSYGFEAIEVFCRAIQLIKEACQYSLQETKP